VNATAVKQVLTVLAKSWNDFESLSAQRSSGLNYNRYNNVRGRHVRFFHFINITIIIIIVIITIITITIIIIIIDGRRSGWLLLVIVRFRLPCCEHGTICRKQFVARACGGDPVAI